MIFEKLRRKIITTICITLVCFMNSMSVYGISDSDYENFNPVNIQKIMDAGHIEIETGKASEYQLNVDMNTIGLGKGYYTAYLYENQYRDWSNYEAMSFYISNESDNTIRINMDVKRYDGKVLSPSDNSNIVVKRETSEMLEKMQPSFGTIELPQGFKGRIYMPFNSFKEKGANSESAFNGITQITSWGIIATMPENDKGRFSLSNFQLINKESSIEYYLNSDISIKGDNIVEIPVVGESISEYRTNETNKNVKFELLDSIDGVSINENGRLSVKPDVEAQNIRISAVLDNRLIEIMDVQLIKSWTLSAREVDGTSKSIPRPEEISNILSNNDKFILSEKFLNSVRIIACIICAAFATLYWWWKREKNNKTS